MEREAEARLAEIGAEALLVEAVEAICEGVVGRILARLGQDTAYDEAASAYGEAALLVAIREIGGTNGLYR